MELVTGLVNHILEIRQQAKANKDFATSDRIRNMLAEPGIEVKDRKDGTEWSIRWKYHIDPLQTKKRF